MLKERREKEKMSQLITTLQTMHPLEGLIWISLVAPILGGLVEHHGVRPSNKLED